MKNSKIPMLSIALLALVATGGCDDLITDPDPDPDPEVRFEAVAITSCVGGGGSCSEIEIELNVAYQGDGGQMDDDTFVNYLFIRPNGNWDFDGLSGAWSRGSPVVWRVHFWQSGEARGMSVVPANPATSSAEPLRLRFQMAAWDTPEVLHEIDFRGYGSTDPIAGQHEGFTFEGSLSLEEKRIFRRYSHVEEELDLDRILAPASGRDEDGP